MFDIPLLINLSISLKEHPLKETRNSYFCITLKNHKFFFFFLSDDLHILQTAQTTNKNIHKIEYIKLNNTTTKPYVLFQNAMRLQYQKTKKTIK